MALYSVQSIVKDVLVLLDENNISRALLTEEATFSLSIRDIIRGRIEDAAKQVVAGAPAHILSSGAHLEFSGELGLHIEDDGRGWVNLPDDFLRLIAFKMSDWDRAVYETISPTDEEYEMQFCKFGGVRGNKHNPVVALVFQPNYRVLEFFTSAKDADVEYACYIPCPYITEDDQIDLPPRCYESVVYSIAVLVCNAMGATQQANIFNELSKASMV